MRYTISSPETETRLATVDARESGDFEVALEGAQGNKAMPLLLKGVTATMRDGVFEARWSEPAGSRAVFPAYRGEKDGVFVVATALGNFRLAPSRGVSLEASLGKAAMGKSLKSSMPGKVLKILCKPGDSIEAGQPLLIIEAMKMENEIRSPQAGVVEQVSVQAGQSIQTGDLLVKLGRV